MISGKNEVLWSTDEHIFVYTPNLVRLTCVPSANSYAAVRVYGSLDMLREIMGRFLASTALRVLRLPPMPRLEKIGEGFLSGCGNLEALHLPPMPRLQILARGFVSSCARLRELRLPPMPRLEKLGEDFLSGCRNLEVLRLPPMPRLQVLPRGFVSDCARLRELRLSPMPRVEIIGDGFLGNTPGLRALRFPPELPALREIGGDFLAGIPWRIAQAPLSAGPPAPGLGEIVLPQLPALEAIGRRFLAGRRDLKILRIPPLPHLASAGGGFLLDSQGLEEVEIGPVPLAAAQKMIRDTPGLRIRAVPAESGQGYIAWTARPSRHRSPPRGGYPPRRGPPGGGDGEGAPEEEE